MKCKADFLRVR